MEQGILEATEINSIHSSYVMHIGNDANATEERENNKLLARNPTKKKTHTRLHFPCWQDEKRSINTFSPSLHRHIYLEEVISNQFSLSRLSLLRLLLPLFQLLQLQILSILLLHLDQLLPNSFNTNIHHIRSNSPSA
jgi:hypothetical protein